MLDNEQIPSGYRQAITTAITVFLGFSITLLRAAWGIEGKRGWSNLEISAESTIAIGVIIQITALFRAIALTDNSHVRYRTTAYIFKVGVVFVVGGVLMSIITR
jgi:hypothetical protein